MGAVLLFLGGTGCADSAPGTAGDVPVLAPGAPGGTATPASEEQLAAALEDVRHNEADHDYIVAMIAHHGQALEMTALAPDRVRDPGLRTLAERIDLAQQPEIDLMEDWLETNVYGPGRENPAHQDYCGLEGGPDHHGADGCVEPDHSAMPGMATPEQLDELEAASGAEFDALFVELMVAHHEGGVSMAEDVMIDGRHPRVLTMANDLITDQRVEIGRLESVLDD
ncbi:DUF305 domain-containing protein [Actinorugispora endophytica]